MQFVSFYDHLRPKEDARARIFGSGGTLSLASCTVGGGLRKNKLSPHPVEDECNELYFTDVPFFISMFRPVFFETSKLSGCFVVRPMEHHRVCKWIFILASQYLGALRDSYSSVAAQTVALERVCVAR